VIGYPYRIGEAIRASAMKKNTKRCPKRILPFLLLSVQGIISPKHAIGIGGTRLSGSLVYALDVCRLKIPNSLS
jgi:hypothetical protein